MVRYANPKDIFVPCFRFCIYSLEEIASLGELMEWFFFFFFFFLLSWEQGNQKKCFSCMVVNLKKILMMIQVNYNNPVKVARARYINLLFI